MKAITRLIYAAWLRFCIQSVVVQMHDNSELMQLTADPFARSALRHRREVLSQQLLELRQKLDAHLGSKPGQVRVYGVA